MRSFTVLGAIVALSLLVADRATAATQVLVNGSFEDTGAAVHDPAGFYTLGTMSGGDVALPGWSVTGTVDAITAGGFYRFPYEGENALDLAGLGPGTISQTFSTIAGTVYTLELYWARGLATPLDAVATLDGPVSAVFFANLLPGANADRHWQRYRTTFLGGGNSQTLTLRMETPGGSGLYFDAVSVSYIPDPGPPPPAPVPEPGVWTLLIAGFGLTGAALRRRRALPNLA